MSVSTFVFQHQTVILGLTVFCFSVLRFDRRRDPEPVDLSSSGKRNVIMILFLVLSFFPNQ